MKKPIDAVVIPQEGLVLNEIVTAEVFRAKTGGYSVLPDEIVCVNDLIVTTGRKYLAQRIASGDTVASAMAYMAVGTVGTAAALSDTTLTGEVKRKALSTNSTTSNDNNYFAVCTFGGAADSLTGIVLQEASIINHASSGFGTMFQRVTYSSVTLQNSDLLKLTLQTNVGSS